MPYVWPTVLGSLLRAEDLPAALAEQVMDEIVSDAGADRGVRRAAAGQGRDG